MNQYQKLFLLSLSLLCVSAKAMEAGAGVEDVVEKTSFWTNVSKIPKTPGSFIKIAAGTFFIWSVVKFVMTEPHNRPVRYSVEEIMKGQNLANNFKYLILDGLIGHKSKRPSLRTYPDGKVSPQLCESYSDLKPTHQVATVVLRPGAYPKGIYGWTFEYSAPLITAAAMITAIGKWKTDFTNGLNGFIEAGFDLGDALPEPEIAE